MKADAIIINLAYPETIVRLPDEWYANYMHYFGIGNKRYVRAGHAALVLIDKQTAKLEYFDFGRYITPKGFGRLRSAKTDHELKFNLKAEIEKGSILNLNALLKCLATNPKLTHGQGTLYASVCDEVNYKKAKTYLNNLQSEGLVRYAAFTKNATNCARIVADCLTASTTDKKIKERLMKLQRFTPSTVGTVVTADTQNHIYKVSVDGNITEHRGSFKLKTSKLFLDRLKCYQPVLEGTMNPTNVNNLPESAQWLGGIGAGAWYCLLEEDDENLYHFQRISPYGTIDTDGWFQVDENGFSLNENYQFQYPSNCETFRIKQKDRIFEFKFRSKYQETSLKQMVHSA